MIKIRMARGGRANRPVYTIVATDSRMPRDGRFLERLGQYNPKEDAPLKGINAAGIAAWMSKGAVLSDTVKSLLKKHSIEIKLS